MARTHALNHYAALCSNTTPPLHLPDNFHARPPSKTQLWHSPDTLAETTRGKGRGGNDALPRGFARATALRKRPPAPSLLHSNMSQSQGHAHRLCLKLCLKKEAHQGSAERGCRLCFRRPSPGQRRGHVKGLAESHAHGVAEVGLLLYTNSLHAHACRDHMLRHCKSICGEKRALTKLLLGRHSRQHQAVPARLAEAELFVFDPSRRSTAACAVSLPDSFRRAEAVLELILVHAEQRLLQPESGHPGSLGLLPNGN